MMSTKETILISHNSRIAGRILASYCEEEGYEVIFTQSTAETTESDEDKAFGAIFLDLAISDPDAFEVCREIRNNGKASTPVFALSSAINDDVIIRCKNAGLSGCIPKPASKADLLDAIVNHAPLTDAEFFLPAFELADTDTVEAVKALYEMEERDDPSVLPMLFRYIDLPGADEATAIMARNLVHALLRNQEKYILHGLEEGGYVTRDICVHHAGEMSLESAVPCLMRLLQEENYEAQKQKIITALGHMNDKAVFQTLLGYVDDEQTLTSLAAIGACGKPENSFLSKDICRLIHHDETIRACAAADSLGQIGDEIAIDALAEHIHHDHPVVRKCVLDSLTLVGKACVTKVAAKLSSKSDDEAIMAANVLGFIGHGEAVEALEKALPHPNPNVRFASYEALGKIRTRRACTALLNGLSETDYPTLCSVVHAIDHSPLPQLAKEVGEVMSRDTQKKDRIIAAIVDTRATALFSAFLDDRLLLKIILNKVVESKNMQTLESFLEVANTIENHVTRKGCQAMLKMAMDRLGEPVMRVLAADDSRTVRFLFESMLPALGYSIVTAKDGQELIDMFDEDGYDIIITDMNMPNKSGIEATEYIRQECNSKVPIVMITTESKESQVRAANDAGVNGFLNKPFTKSDLHTCLKGLG